VVAHAIVLKMIMSHFENLPLERLFDERILQPTSLSIVEVNQQEIRIIQYGTTEHYSVVI
jgi:probable phosphoglycerate mutase